MYRYYRKIQDVLSYIVTSIIDRDKSRIKLSISQLNNTVKIYLNYYRHEVDRTEPWPVLKPTEMKIEAFIHPVKCKQTNSICSPPAMRIFDLR